MKGKYVTRSLLSEIYSVLYDVRNDGFDVLFLIEVTRLPKLLLEKFLATGRELQINESCP